MLTAALLADGHATRRGGADKSRLLAAGVSMRDRQSALLRMIASHVVIRVRLNAAHAPVRA